MNLSIYQHIPQYINPIAFTIGFFAVRWYAILFGAGFLVVFGLLRWRICAGEIQLKDIEKSGLKLQNLLIDFILISFLSALIGGRIGYAIFYEPLYFFSSPLSLISPFDGNGYFTGIYGMSYHGALLGIVLGNWIFFRKKKISFLVWADFVSPAVALGYFFGRLGNFLNGELYGRMTNFNGGMYFKADPNNLRHPSQLYEAFLEGIILFFILWKIRNNKMREGFIFAIYLIGYGILRIFAEQFRAPDAQIGYVFNLFTEGQLLSFLTLLVGLFLLISKKRKNVIMETLNILKKKKKLRKDVGLSVKNTK